MTHAETRTIGYGFAASVAVHLLLLGGFGMWMGSRAIQDFAHVRPVPVEEPEVTLLFPDSIEVAPAPAPEPVPEVPEVPKSQKPVERYIRTTQNTESAEAPKDAAFVSDMNTVASAKLVPSPGSDSLLPTMNGVNIATDELANRNYKDGETKNDSAPGAPATPPAAASMSEPAPPVPPVPPAPLPPPMPELKAPDPEPAPKTEIAKKKDSPAELKMKELDAAMEDGKSERLPLEIRSPSEEPMESPPEPPPAPPPVIPVPEMSVPKAQPVEESMPSAPKPEKDAFQPETRTSQVKGSISNIGSEDAVNAMATPTGRYMRRVTQAIEQKWHTLRREKQDFVEPGKLRLKFYVNKDGQPEDISIIFNEANAVLTDFTLTAILKAELPPIPKDLLPILEKERVEIEYDVVIY